jgi:hypothetical protein
MPLKIIMTSAAGDRTCGRILAVAAVEDSQFGREVWRTNMSYVSKPPSDTCRMNTSLHEH